MSLHPKTYHSTTDMPIIVSVLGEKNEHSRQYILERDQKNSTTASSLQWKWTLNTSLAQPINTRMANFATCRVHK